MKTIIEKILSKAIVSLGVVYADILSIQSLFALITGKITILSGLSLLCAACAVGVLTTVSILLLFGHPHD